MKTSMHQESKDPFPMCFGAFGYFRTMWAHLMKCTDIFRANFQILLLLCKWQLTVASTGDHKRMLDLDFDLLQIPVLNQGRSRANRQGKGKR